MEFHYRPWTGLAWGLITFASVGTITAVWSNPWFTRMTSVAVWEFPAVLLLAILTGVFFAVRFTACGARRAGIGGVLSFIGIACPVCNKILMLVFGGPLLLAFFDPVRPYIALAGLILLAVGIYRNIAARRAALATAWVMS